MHFEDIPIKDGTIARCLVGRRVWGTFGDSGGGDVEAKARFGFRFEVPSLDREGI
jgi:hypothetical protein